MIHRRCKKRKYSTTNRPQESVDCNSTIRIETIAIDNVIHALPEGHKTSCADECYGYNLRHPDDGGEACPSGIPMSVSWLPTMITSRILMTYANQKNEMGKTIAPRIMGGSRSSGIGFPYLMYARLKFVADE